MFDLRAYVKCVVVNVIVYFFGHCVVVVVTVVAVFMLLSMIMILLIFCHLLSSLSCRSHRQSKPTDQ